MTVAVDSNAGRGSEGLRWGACLAAVLAIHAAVGVLIAGRSVPPEPVAPPAAAVMIDLAPLPSAPSAEPTNDAPSPEAEPPPPAPSEPVPAPEPVPVPEPVPSPEPMPTPEAEVALPAPAPPPSKPRPPRPESPRAERSRPPQARDPTPFPTAAAPPSVPPAAVASPTAPASGSPAAPALARSATPSPAAVTWQGLVLDHLERHKRYPRAAQLRRQEGVVHVRFTLDRQGNVIDRRLERGSGHDSLDEETLALVRRASPLPAPPVDVEGDTVELVVPVRFALR